MAGGTRHSAGRRPKATREIEVQKEVGERLHKAFFATGWTYERFIDELEKHGYPGITSAILTSHFTKGKITVYALKAFCEVLKVTPSFALTGEDPEQTMRDFTLALLEKAVKDPERVLKVIDAQDKKDADTI